MTKKSIPWILNEIFLICILSFCFNHGGVTAFTPMRISNLNSHRATCHISALKLQTDESKASSINGKTALEEAERLRQKAKELMDKATKEENMLRLSRTQEESKKSKMLDEIYEELTKDLMTPVEEEGEIDVTTQSELGRRLLISLEKKQLSSSTMILLVERLYKRLSDAEKRIQKLATIDEQDPSNNNFNIGDRSNSREFLESEIQMLKFNIDQIINAQTLLDAKQDAKRGLAPQLEARLRELIRADEEEFQRQLAIKVNSNSDELIGVNGYVSDTLGDMMQENVTIRVNGKEIVGPKVNITSLMEDIIQVPMWVPSSILPFLIVCRKVLDPEDLKKIRSDVLGDSNFRVENWDYTKWAAVYRGSFVKNRQTSFFRSKSILDTNRTVQSGTNLENEEIDIAQVFSQIQLRLEQAGLADKIQLFLMEDPEWRPGESRDPEPLPTIIAVSSNVIPEQGAERGKGKKAITALSIVGTIIATFAYSVSSYALNPTFFDSIINKNDISNLPALLPVFLGVFALSGVHEIAHHLIAKRNDVQIGLPVPIPSLQIGTFGNITPLRSFPKDRNALFDVAISGPLTAAFFSILLMVVGINLSVSASTETLSTFAVVPAALMKTSFLVGSMCSILAPKVMTLPASQLIPIHPMFLVGFAGVISNALNLLPIGRLDGGRATTAVFGRRSAYLLSFLTLLFLAIAALTQTSAISIFFGLIVTLFQRNADIPMRDELTEIDEKRATIFTCAMIFIVLTLAPFPGGPAL